MQQKHSGCTVEVKWRCTDCVSGFPAQETDIICIELRQSTQSSEVMTVPLNLCSAEHLHVLHTTFITFIS